MTAIFKSEVHVGFDPPASRLRIIKGGMWQILSGLAKSPTCYARISRGGFRMEERLMP